MIFLLAQNVPNIHVMGVERLSWKAYETVTFSTAGGKHLKTISSDLDLMTIGTSNPMKYQIVRRIYAEDTGTGYKQPDFRRAATVLTRARTAALFAPFSSPGPFPVDVNPYLELDFAGAASTYATLRYLGSSGDDDTRVAKFELSSKPGSAIKIFGQIQVNIRTALPKRYEITAEGITIPGSTQKGKVDIIYRVHA